MTWALVVVGGSALIGGAASYAGSKKQSDASKAAANLNMDQFRTINAQNQPFIQSATGQGGALSRLNTLLGLSPNPTAQRQAMGPPQQFQMSTPLQGPQSYAPTPNGGMQQRFANEQAPPGDPRMYTPERNGGFPNVRLQQILALRAQHGDTQAQQLLARFS